MAKFSTSEKKVRKMVADYLDPNEEVEAHISQGGMTKSYLVNRVLVATDKRIIFVDKDSTAFKEGFQSFRYKDIDSINAVKGVLYSKIVFICGINTIQIKDVDKKEAKVFVDLINAKREEVKDEPLIINNSSEKSVAEQLKEFKELLDMEIITLDEFNQKKAELLG